jgi:hypothetical protein
MYIHLWQAVTDERHHQRLGKDNKLLIYQLGSCFDTYAELFP